MDLEQLKAEHPDVYKAAAAEGRDEERKRVKGLITMGEKANAPDIAAKAIKEGLAVNDPEFLADFHGALVDKTHIDQKQKDDDDVNASLKNVDDKVDDKDDADSLDAQVAALWDAENGGAK